MVATAYQPYCKKENTNIIHLHCRLKESKPDFYESLNVTFFFKFDT